MKDAGIESAALRKLLAEVLRTDSAFDAFCHDHFENVYAQFSAGMDHTAKVTLLLKSVRDNEKILALLIKKSSGQEAVKQIPDAYLSRQPLTVQPRPPKLGLAFFAKIGIPTCAIILTLSFLLNTLYTKYRPQNDKFASSSQDGFVVKQIKYFNIFNDSNLLFDQVFAGNCSPKPCHGLIYQNFSNTLFRPTYRLPLAGAEIIRARVRIYAALGGESTKNPSAKYCLSIDINGVPALEKVPLTHLEGGQPPRGPFGNFRFETINLPLSALKHLRNGDNQLTFRVGCAQDGDWIVFQSSELQVEVEI